MVGRNDPCICGSGKKYKKCCGKSQVADIKTLVDEELGRVMAGFAREGLGRREYGEIETRFRTWISALRDTLDAATIETVAFETYVYVERKDLWVEYLNREMGKNHREQVKEVLQSWKNPFWLMGEVIDRKDGFIYLKDGLSGGTYMISGQETPMIGDCLFGVVLPDFRNGSQKLYGTNGLIFIPKRRKSLIAALLDKLKSFDGDVLELYHSFGRFDQGNGFSPFEQDVIKMVKDYVKAFGLTEYAMIQLVHAYLLNNDVRAKKAGAVAAGLIQSAVDFEIISPSKLTQKEMAAYFDVSTSTMAKYREMVGDYISLSIKLAEETSKTKVTT